MTLQDIQTYGKVYKARVGGRWIIYISDTEDIKYIQVTNFANYARHKIAKELLQPLSTLLLTYTRANVSE